ncbi:MAG: hypothetical protein FWD68_11945 [Alphaproteobacteria bacterium]|nr:hypothetical protein [Alphaproteobacteria bacterium]
MSLTLSPSVPRLPRLNAPLLAALLTGAAALLGLMLLGDGMLNDPDTFWQVKVGQWILGHHALPSTDIYSFTRLNAPWISTSWLSQVLLALSYGLAGVSGPVLLTLVAIALSVTLLGLFLNAHLEIPRSLLFVILAAAQSVGHFLARPHMLALPVMVAWVGLLMRAADRRTTPSLLFLPLMALWANLHGSFVLGLMLIGPIALVALWEAAAEERVALFARWVLFGIAAAIASCCTPYGYATPLASLHILSLGKALNVIIEWYPSNFSSFSLFALALLALIAIAFHFRIRLSPPRILLVLGLLWMALNHARNVEVFAFLVPLVLAKPIGELAPLPTTGVPSTAPTRVAALAIVLATLAITATYTSIRPFRVPEYRMPVAAVDAIERHQLKRVFNEYGYGGYLIWRDIPVFIDGRTELYG